MICVYRSVTGRSPSKSSLVDSSEPSTKDRNNDNKMGNHERSKSRISRLLYVTEQRFMCYKAVIRSGNTELSSSGIGQDTGKQRTHDHSENGRYCARARTLDSSACKTHLCAPHACENKRVTSCVTLIKRDSNCATRWTIWGSTPCRDKRFLFFPKCPKRFWRLPCPAQWSFASGKASSAQVKNEKSYTSTPPRASTASTGTTLPTQQLV